MTELSLCKGGAKSIFCYIDEKVSSPPENTLHLYFTPHGKNSFQWVIDLIVKDKMINIQYKKKHSYKICKHTYTRAHRLH